MTEKSSTDPVGKCWNGSEALREQKSYTDDKKSDMGEGRRPRSVSFGENKVCRLDKVEPEDDDYHGGADTMDTEKPLLMDDISSFLETMHSKNLTLKKLARVQQSRIEELIREIETLKRESEQKDELIAEITSKLSQTGEGLHEVVSAAAREEISLGGLDMPSHAQASHERRGPTEARLGSTQSSPIKNCGARGTGPARSNNAKKSITVSHRVGVGRMMHLVRKINSVRKNGNFAFHFYYASRVLQALLPLLMDDAGTLPTI